MTWTYDATQIDTTSAVGRRNAVRLLIGDTDVTETQLQDEELDFHLVQATDDIYLAAAAGCRSLSAKYSRLVNTTQDDGMLRVDYSDLQTHYSKLAKSMETASRRFGSSSIGSPVATGISVSANDALNENTDRPADRFQSGQFRNPGVAEEVSS